MYVLAVITRTEKSVLRRVHDVPKCARAGKGVYIHPLKRLVFQRALLKNRMY
jgi:hypothetical protein